MKKSYGIIGNPIKHSLSPVLHNYWFKKYKIDANYSIIESNDKDLPENSAILNGPLILLVFAWPVKSSNIILKVNTVKS